jgi:hypothetical protein
VAAVVGKEMKLSEITEKEVRKAIAPLLRQGWRLLHEGHKARLQCPCNARCTTIPVGGSTRDEGNTAKRIKRESSRCPLPKDSPRRSLTGMDRD